MSESLPTESLPPMVFEPRLVPKLWGGKKLGTVLGKKLPEAGGAGGGIGESWEVFDFPPGFVEGNKEWISAKVASGALKGRTLHELVVGRAELLLGKRVPIPTEFGPQFPLLIKYLDAREDLSIQVHPTLAYTLEHGEAHLKTECWIILDAEKGAVLYKGLKEGVTRESFEAGMKAGKVAEMIRTVGARKGDCHFLPSGAVHALGAGVLVAEVQTPSDTTFRVFDFNRVEAATGKPRKLHEKEALACIAFEDADKERGGTPVVTSMRDVGRPLVECEYFRTTTVKAAAHTVRALPAGEMRIWMVTEGGVKFRWGNESLFVKAGGTVVLPAGLVGGVVAGFGVNTVYLETVVP